MSLSLNLSHLQAKDKRERVVKIDGITHIITNKGHTVVYSSGKALTSHRVTRNVNVH